MGITTAWVILGKGCGISFKTQISWCLVPQAILPPFLSLSAIKGCSLESFSLGLDVFLGGRQSGGTERCSNTGLTLSSLCPWPPLGPMPSCCPPSLPPKHHPGYHRGLDCAFPWQRAALEAWPTQRELSHPWCLCAFFLRTGLYPATCTILGYLAWAWLWEGLIYILFSIPTPIPAVSQEMRPLLGQLSHLPRHPTVSPAWLGTGPAVQSGKLSNSVF